MKYNFDKIASRRNTSSIKWDVKENELPMWVADMDFLVMPEIQEAISEASKSNGFGYTYPTKEYFEAYRQWWSSRHHINIDTSSMIFVSGVVSALDSIIRKVTNENDGIMILSPVYHAFYNIIRNNSRVVVTSSLIKEGDNYFINYQDIEDKFKTSNVNAFIFCNPHNPIGRIWKKEEIKQLSDLCDKYDVVLISDEIHCDIVDPGYEYNSVLNVNDSIITCLSPGKVFNLAGIHSAVVVAKNKKQHDVLQLAFYRDDIGEPNYFALPVTITAYGKGATYVDELNEYLYKNKQYVAKFIKDNLPQIKLEEGHATYLLWLDISSMNMRSGEFCKELQEQTGLILSPGIQFGHEGDYHVRMNVATSLDNVKDAMNRLMKLLTSKEK